MVSVAASLRTLRLCGLCANAFPAPSAPTAHVFPGRPPKAYHRDVNNGLRLIYQRSYGYSSNRVHPRVDVQLSAPLTGRSGEVPSGTGVTDETNLPVRWSASENVVWKAPIGGLGVSTPIVAGDRVFVTSQQSVPVFGARGNHPRLVQGGNAADAGERELGASRTTAPAERRTVFLVESFSRTNGARLWQHRLAATGTLPGVHDKHNLASPSPVTDGQMVYAWFGTGQIVALDLNGKMVWQRHLGQEISPFDVIWGHSSSPTLFGDLLILLCDHEPASCLLAVDKRTGKERWRADRGKGRMSYSTPLVVDTPSGPG